MSQHEQIREGQQIPPMSWSIDTTQLVKFAAVAEDFSRQHWDQPYMASLGFPNVIVHGWLTLTHMCQAVTAWLPPETATILSYDARHRRPTFPGLLTCGGHVVACNEEAGKRVLCLELWAKNDAGEVTTSGTMRVALEDSHA
jgi:acyl dehydratase